MNVPYIVMHIPWNSIPLLSETFVAFFEVMAAVVPGESSSGGSFSADVNYLEEFQKGGSVGIALAFLLLAMIGFTVERLLRLRSKSICPHGLVTKVLPMWSEGRFMEIVETCKKRPSLLAKMILYFVEHRQADPELLIPGANDIAVRGLRRHTQRTHSLAVVAALAPLLGLLGTMIGMIESFKLVELYGDEGGASMLAGAISKALVTTAMGLIIAIPSLAIYHFFKARIGGLGNQLEEEIEILINAWFLKQNPEAEAASRARLGQEDAEANSSAV